MSSKIFSVFFSRTWIGTVLRVGGTTEFFEFIFKFVFLKKIIEKTCHSNLVVTLIVNYVRPNGFQCHII